MSLADYYKYLRQEMEWFLEQAVSYESFGDIGQAEYCLEEAIVRESWMAETQAKEKDLRQAATC